MKKVPKNVWYAAVAISVLIAMVVLLGRGSPLTKPPAEVPFSQVIEEVKQDKVESIEVTGDQIVVNLKDGSKQKSYKESFKSLSDFGIDYNKVKVEVKNPDDGAGRWFEIGLAILPILLIIGFFLHHNEASPG